MAAYQGGDSRSRAQWYGDAIVIRLLPPGETMSGRLSHAAHSCSARGPVQMRCCLVRKGVASIGPSRSDRAGKDNWGADHDRTTDAKRRLENHLSAVSVHAGELRGQDRG